MAEMESDLSSKDLSLVCRGCLASSGEMKNMIEWGYAEDFSKFTNIQINHSDNLSELLCTSCEGIVLSCRNFVQQCMQSDLLLRDATQDTPKGRKEKRKKGGCAIFSLISTRAKPKLKIPF